MIHQDTTVDLPEPAHSKAIAAIEEFHVLAVEYSILLDTQRALVAAGNIDGAVDTVARGDRVARQAAACGRRLAPWREALESRKFAGPRASDLARRIAAASTRAVVLAGGAASVENICLQKRDRAELEMRKAQEAAAISAMARYASSVSVHVLDTRG